MSKQSVVIGYSGHAYMICDLLASAGIPLAGYYERAEKSANPFRLAYLGDEREETSGAALRSSDVYLGIGDNAVREKLFRFFVAMTVAMPALIHPSSVISSSVAIRDATVVMPGVVINALADIGNAVICNSACVIEHECRIGDFAHIAPGAVLAGNVTVGRGTFVGANAVVRNGITIGDHVVIGAGAVVVKNIPDNQVVAGNPARKIR